MLVTTKALAGAVETCLDRIQAVLSATETISYLLVTVPLKAGLA